MPKDSILPIQKCIVNFCYGEMSSVYTPPRRRWIRTKKPEGLAMFCIARDSFGFFVGISVQTALQPFFRCVERF